MIQIALSFTALFTAVFTLLVGIGLLGTLLSLRMSLEGYSAHATGLVMAFYYAGLVAGSFVCSHLIERVGHIRAFAAFAALCTVSVLLHALHMSTAGWAVLRLVTGIATFGLYMVIESWLNECTEPHLRGRIFSIYMVLTYSGIAVGQFLLALNDVRSQNLFLIVCIFLALCVVPVAVTNSVHPRMPEASRLKLITVLRKSPLGMLGCLTAGLINSSFYALGPLFANQAGLSTSQVAGFMGVTIAGGLVFQWPIGWISDRFDRTTILAILGGAAALLSLIVANTVGLTREWLYGSSALFGGIIFAVYPVAVARSHDLFEPQDVVAVSTALLLSFGIGASLGPILAGIMIGITGTNAGLYLFISSAGGLYAGLAILFRKKQIIETVETDDQVTFMPMQSTSPVVTSIDPRTEAPPEAAG